MTIKAVVFDLDGTIAAFNLDYRNVRIEVRSFLITVGIPPSTLSTNESVFEMLKKAEIYMKNSGKSESAFKKVREKALAITEKYEFEAAKTTRLLPGVAETLKALRKMKLKIGLCTINSHKSAEHIFERFKIREYFDVVTTRERVKNVKPNTEHLQASLKALQVKPREAVVVGDGITDMRCARELSVLAIGLSNEKSPHQELVGSGANYIITNMIDLPILISDINAATKRQGKREKF